MRGRRLLRSRNRRQRRYASPRGPERLEDRHLLTAELISVDIAGDSAGTGLPISASNPAMNASGRYVAFQSDATDLVPGLLDTNGGTDVFVRDRLFGITIPISLAAGLSFATGDDRSFDPAISEDGRYIAFGSAASNLLAEPLLVDAPVNVFVHDRDTDRDGVFDEAGATETRLLSRNSLMTGDGAGVFGGPSGGDAFGFGVESLRPRISGNGRFVVFGSFADNLSPGISDVNFTADVFRAPTSGTASPTMISDDFTGEVAGGNGVPLPASGQPDISRSGRIVVFVSEANNLVKDAELGAEADIYAHDFDTRTTTLVSVNFAGDDGGDTGSTDPDLSSDGRFVVWESAATNLVAPGINTNGTATDVFRRAVGGGPIELVSVTPTGTSGDGPSEDASVSDTGRFVVFESLATDLISDPAQLAAGVLDTNTVADVYVRDMLLRTTALVSINATGTAAGVGFTASVMGSSINPVISGNGRYVAFESFAEDLVAGATVAGRNLYVRDLITGVTRLVTEDIDVADADDGAPNELSSSFQPQITPDGAVVAFKGDADDLVMPDSNDAPDVFVSTGTPDLIADGSTSSLSSPDIVSFRYSRVFPALIGPFEIGFYRSTDELFDISDGAPLFTRPATGLATSLSSLVYSLGGATGLPGAGAPEDDEDYSILAVVDHLDEVTEDDGDVFNEDNTAAFVADYQLPGMPWMVHGSGDSDLITFSTPSATSLELAFNERSRTLPLAVVPAARIRAHGGDDTVTGSPLDDFIHGGDGDDFLVGGDGDDTIADGLGDDTIDAGSGDDLIIATPGSDDLFIDGGGNDTLSFSSDDQFITLDLDSAATQVVDPQGNTVRLIGQWENFLGSPLGSRLYARPLAVPRHLQGGSGPNDELVFDALGLNVVFDGNTFTIPGMGPVTVSGFERVVTVHAASRVVDDGGGGYSDTGFGFLDTTQGFDSDVRFSGAGSGNTATWTFDELAPGTYAVSATWTFAPDRASNSPFSIRDGGPTDSITSTIDVNQQQNPGEFDPPDDGQDIFFRNLDIVQVTGSQLTVQLSDIGADEFVVADAIRIEPLSSRRIIDDAAAGFSTVGFVEQTLNVAAAGRGAFGDTHYSQADGDTATYNFVGLPPGLYSVSATWTAGSDRATNSSLNVQAAGVPSGVVVNQQLAPDDFVEAGIAWERLVQARVGLDGQLLVQWQSLAGTNGLVIADAIRLDPIGELEISLQSAAGAPPVLIDPGTQVNLPVATNRVGSGPDAQHLLTIRNTGDDHLHIDSIQLGGVGFQLAGAPPLPLSVPPGATETFRVEVDAAGLGTISTDLAIEFFGLSSPMQFELIQNIIDDANAPEFNIGGLSNVIQAPRFTDPLLLPGVNQQSGLPDGMLRVVDDLGFGESAVSLRLLGPGYDQTLTFGPGAADPIPTPIFEQSFVFPRPLPIGSYTLTGTVTDLAGNVGLATPIDFEILPAAPPVVEIVAPSSGNSFIEGQRVLLEADALDDVGVQRVEFLVEGNPVAVDDSTTEGPFFGEFFFPPSSTVIEVHARATDSAGQVGASGIVELTLEDDTPPQVGIVTPTDGTQWLEGTTQSIRVEATDDVAIERVELFVENSLVASSPASPLMFDLAVPSGVTSLMLQAKAYDRLGNERQTAITQVGVTAEPAGAVDAIIVGRTLQIRGSQQRDHVRITATGEGQLRVSGMSGTTVNGDAAEVDFPQVSAVVVRMGAESDVVELRSLDGASLQSNVADIRWPTMTIHLGVGDDLVNVAGVEFNGALTVIGGRGNDVFEAVDSVFGHFYFFGAEDHDQLLLTNVNLRGYFRAILSDGDDMLRAVDSTFQSLFYVAGGRGRDRVELTRDRMQRTAWIDAGGGDDEIVATDTVFASMAGMLLGSGNDTLDFFGVHARSSVLAIGGRGHDTLRLRDSRLRRLLLSPGPGRDDVDLTGTYVRYR